MAYTPTPLTPDELRESNDTLRESREEAWAKVHRLAQALRYIRDTSLDEVWVNVATRALEEAGVEDPDDFAPSPTGSSDDAS